MAFKTQKQTSEQNPFSGRKYIRAIGRRKSASAVVQLFTKGKGKFFVNKMPLPDYFATFELNDLTKSPLEKTGKIESCDVNAKVSGGGRNAQAQAVRLALARALVDHNEDFKPQMRALGFLTVDRRVKERKKPGLKRARRAPQWSKR